MFMIHAPMLPPMPLELLIKLAGHPEDRLRERTSLPLEALDPVRQGVRHASLPHGSHHVRLPDGSFAVLKDVSQRGRQPRHVLATVLGPDMNPPGYDVTQEVIDIDPDDVRVVSFSEGDKQRRGDTFKAKERHGKNSHSFEVQRTHHSVKVASFDEDDVRTRVRNLQHDPETIRRYARVMERENRYLRVSPEQLPRKAPPSNDSDETKAEILEIVETMQRAPLSEPFVSAVSQNVVKVAQELCESFGLDSKADVTSELAKDALYISMFLKYHYLRPRPYQIAPYFDNDIESADQMAESTPSYPSGHTMMGVALARFYSTLYPEHADAFEDFGEKVGLSRIQAGVHYPSDVVYARELIDALMGPAKIAPKREKKASLMGAAIGAATAGNTKEEKVVAATGGAVGGLAGGIAGLGAGVLGSAMLGMGLRGGSGLTLATNTVGTAVGGYMGGQRAVSAYRRKKTPNLDRKVKR